MRGVESPTSVPAAQEVQPTQQPEAGRLTRLTSGTWSKPAATLAALAAVVLIAIVAAPAYWLFVLNVTMIAAIAAIGLNLLTGFAGQVSVGNAAFLAIGAYSAVAMSRFGFLPALVAGAVAAGVIGLVVGLPALRLRGLYLAISTLALQFIVQFVLEKIQESSPTAIAGYTLPTASIGPITLDSDPRWAVALGFAAGLTLLVSWFLVKSRPGRAWVAVREHDVAAAIVGVNVSWYKLLAFLVSSLMIGGAGVLRAYYNGHVSYEEFSLDLTVAYVAMVIIGGLGSLPGTLLGVIVVSVLPFVVQAVGTSVITDPRVASHLFQNLALIETGFYGLVVLAFLMFEPRGMAALVERAWRAIAAALRSRGRSRAGG